MCKCKRLFDLAVVLAALPLWGPVFLAIALLVRFKLGSPIFFKQKRAGLNGEPFTIIKFRSMAPLRDTNGQLLPDHARLTPFGRFLRSTSLDELPELWNVLRGEMSLVGPRPLLLEYLPRYSPHQARRHEVLPGMTGWAQVHGRNSISWEEKFSRDLWYLEHQSILLDFKILALTLRAVLSRKSLKSDAIYPVPEFRGSGAVASEGTTATFPPLRR